MFSTFFKTALVTCVFTLSTLSAHASEGMKEWEAQVREEISEKQYYPKAAKDSGIEGSVKVRFDVTQTGLITSVQIVETSGNDILDAQALKVAAKMDKLPTLPLGVSEYAFIVPIKFQTLDSQDKLLA